MHLAIKRVELLMHNFQPESEEATELDELADRVVAYERIHYPIGIPSPITAILVSIEQAGLTRKDLEPMIGSRARVSEVLSGKRALTLPMIRRLSAGLGIPADVLIQPMPIAPLKPRTQSSKTSSAPARKRASAG